MSRLVRLVAHVEGSLVEIDVLVFYFIMPPPLTFPFFFFNDTATTEIYTLSLHDALRSFGSYRDIII